MKHVWIVRCKKALLVCESIMLLVVVSAFAGKANGVAYASETGAKEQEVYVKEENTDVDEKELTKVDITQGIVESEASEKVEEIETENMENNTNQGSTTTESNTTQEDEPTEDISTSEPESDTSEETESIEPNVKISIELTEGWFKDTALVYVKVEDIVNSGNFVIESVKAKISQNGSWVDITEDMRFSVSENCSVYVKVTDQNGKNYERNRYISCFDKTKPILNAAVNGGLLSVQAKDNESGVLAVYVNGYEFTELNNGVLNVRLQQFDTGYEYFTIQAVDRAGNISDVYRTVNPYYEDSLAEKKEETPLPESATPTEPTDAEANVTEHTTEAEKEFYTIQTDSEKVFYLIIDKTGEQEKVYFLTEISERDLLNVTSDNSETLPMNSAVVESALPNDIPKTESTEKIESTEKVETTESTDLEEKETDNKVEKESEDTEQESNSTGIYIVMVVVGVIAISFGYYFKVVKKKEDFEDEEKLEDEIFEKEDEVENETDEEDFFDQEDFKMKLVVAEKPSVARSIANVLGANSFQGGYIVGNGYIVSWCIGHLVELAEPESYGEQWKIWSYASLPIQPKEWKYKIKGETKAQFEVLCYLMNEEEVTEVICATDAGREGELIFRLVYEMAGSTKPIKRLWISSMEERAIKDGFAHLKAGSEYENLYCSALCRQKADWLVGINGTRLFSVLYGNKVLKVGRVQTPTLAMLAEREKMIKNFEREQYFVTHLLCDGMDMVTEHLKNRTEAERIAGACRNGQALVISVTKEEKQAIPPKLYDLTTLQREANRLFGFTAKQTLEYAQSLYEKKLLTYPRTDSRYLSDDMEQTASDVIRSIFGKMPFVPQVMFQPDLKKVLNSKKVTDHHAIIPTMEIQKVSLETLPETERKLLCFVACRLLCATSKPYVYEIIKAEFLCEDNIFHVFGKSVVKDGWKLFEDAFKKHFKTSEEKTSEKKLPKLTEGMSLKVTGTRVTEHYTSPPSHFTEDTLLSFMERAGNGEMCEEVERKGLGTPATRADIIEKLVRDGLVQRDRKYLMPTEDGEKLLMILPDSVKSPKLTADWENALSLVAKGELTEDTFLRGIEAMINEMIESNAKPKAEYRKFFVREQDMLGDCPKCGNPILKGKYGAYCMGKCGMNVSRYFKTLFTDMQIRELLAGKQILLKGLIGKNNRTYDVFLKPTGIEEYSYEKNGKTVTGYQFVYEKSYPKKSAKKKKK